MLVPENKWVLRLDLKAVQELLDLRSLGREFQREVDGSARIIRSQIIREGIPKRRPSIPEPREARIMLTRGFESRLREAERSWHDEVYECSKDDKYWGHASCSKRRWRVVNLKSISCRIGSCSDVNWARRSCWLMSELWIIIVIMATT